MSQEEIDEVYSLHQQFMESMKSGGVSAVLGQLDEGVKFYPPGEPAIEGLAAVEKWCQKADAELTFANIEGSGEEYTHAGDYIIETGQFSWNLKPKAGGDAVAEKGTFLAVWKRQADGSWKIARDIWNSDLPMPQE